jgi:hypothetical protein
LAATANVSFSQRYITKPKSSRESTIGLLICTLISENQWSASNLRKISGPAHLNFFLVCLQDGINLNGFLGGDLEKNPGLQDLKFF